MAQENSVALTTSQQQILNAMKAGQYLCGYSYDNRTFAEYELDGNAVEKSDIERLSELKLIGFGSSPTMDSYPSETPFELTRKGVAS